MTFYQRITALSGDIEIGPAATVSGTIGAMVGDGCLFEGPPPGTDGLPASMGTIPASLTFVPSENALGVAVPTYLSSTGEFEFGEPYRFTTKIPPGEYDIYINPAHGRPLPEELGDCQVPPLLVRRQAITGSVQLAIELPPPTLLELTVRGPVGDRSLDGWSIDVVDSISGRVLSAPRLLLAPTDGGSDYRADVSFVPAQVVIDDKLVVDEELEGLEVIRLLPPPDDPLTIQDESIHPTVLFERGGVDLTPGPDILDLTPPAGNAVPGSAVPANAFIEGQVAQFETGKAVPATVTLSARTIEGASSRASFVTTIQVDETGWFQAELPPGEYRVRATLSSSVGMGSAGGTWIVRALPGVQAGKVVEVPIAPTVFGEATLNGTGDPAFGATASVAVSAWSLDSNVLERAGLASEPPPVYARSSGDVVAKDGRFDISVDPLPANPDLPTPTYDFFVKPEARSNYGWLVSPARSVPVGGLPLGTVRLPLPYVYRGDVIVTDTTTRVPRALIRAYAYLKPDGTYTSNLSEAETVVPVAEARADDSGAFSLLIPASLDGQ
jgi:hypothetical protein